MTASRRGGSTCVVTRPHTPVAPGHLVVRLSTVAGPDERRDEVLLVRAYRAAQELARRELGDPGCFTLLFSGSRTRLRPESHVHVFLLRSVRAKRWLFVRMFAKPLLRWLRQLEVRG
jgi:hypothetical protein